MEKKVFKNKEDCVILTGSKNKERGIYIMLSVNTYMRKSLFILPVVIIAVIFLIWKNNYDKAENIEINSFVLINDIPYMVSEGSAYYWDDDKEAWIIYKENVKKLFRGEFLCVLKDDGSLEICTEESLDLDDTKPLGTLYNINQSNKLLDISQNTPVRTLNKELVCGNCWALCEDGRMFIDPGEEYISFEIPNEIIKDISGKFILTEEGTVYQTENRTFGAFSYKQVSEEKFTAIAACESAPRCIGIREDNTAVMWSDLEPLDLSGWKNVKEIAVGYNYCVGLTTNGKILYADYVKSREADVTKRLRGIRAEHITCCYETIAIIKNDLTVEKISLIQD